MTEDERVKPKTPKTITITTNSPRFAPRPLPPPTPVSPHHQHQQHRNHQEGLHPDQHRPRSLRPRGSRRSRSPPRNPRWRRLRRVRERAPPEILPPRGVRQRHASAAQLEPVAGSPRERALEQHPQRVDGAENPVGGHYSANRLRLLLLPRDEVRDELEGVGKIPQSV